MAQEFATIKFVNAHTEQTVAELGIICKDSFKVMSPFYRKKQDDWKIANSIGYFWGSDGSNSQYIFSYAGFESDEGVANAKQAYLEALDILSKRGKITFNHIATVEELEEA